jgi:hypothetical protein
MRAVEGTESGVERRTTASQTVEVRSFDAFDVLNEDDLLASEDFLVHGFLEVVDRNALDVCQMFFACGEEFDRALDENDLKRRERMLSDCLHSATGRMRESM